MLSEDEKEAIKLLEDIKNNSWTTKYIMSSDSKNADILLNLITKQQKENEDLLREKEENKFIIAMANNEMLGYNQGYLDAKNQNSNATEIVMKNRQAYMHKEEVEFYKRKIDFLQKENEEKDKQIDLMAISILVKKIGDYPCGYKQDCIKSDKEYRDIHCKDCIKQYFETKAKKGE